MNILIVGLGYAGKRFLRALHYIETMPEVTTQFNIAYVDKKQKNIDLPYFDDLVIAKERLQPQLIIVTVNDEFHADILNAIHDFRGFVICEKPLANSKDDLTVLTRNLQHISGFSFDLIERYSQAAITLKQYVRDHQLTLIRAHFYWGKDRINDFRPTCGVTSEVIHALDLIQYVTDSKTDYQLQHALGSMSDFSISGTQVLDSVLLTALQDQAVVTGYSSFVNITRKREIDLTFTTDDHQLVYAHMVFDTPEWDMDYLKIWKSTRAGEEILLELHSDAQPDHSQLQTIVKLVQLTKDVILFIQDGLAPSQAFPDLATAVRLQQLLNSIENSAHRIGPVRYVTGPTRVFVIDENDLERMG